MAFAAATMSSAEAFAGHDLEEVTTEALGFSALGGEKKLRMLPTPWPTDSLPAPTSSLLSIASRKGLVAAAGPDVLVISSTKSVRETITGDGPEDNKIKQFVPQLTIPTPRVSQVAFSADEKFLIISAESGGGLAVFDVQAILQGEQQSAFQIGTNGTSVRALVPNPAQETAGYISLVMSNGHLMLANLNDKQLVNGPNGPVLKEGVSCVSWSVKGKQLLAGMGNGLVIQMKPEGTDVAVIPRPPRLEGDHHVSSINWLANDDFFVVYTPTHFEPGSNPDPEYHLVKRERQTQKYTFHKFLMDPSPPFGLPRSSPHHFMVRLRNFEPNLDDMLITASTAAEEVGLITCSKTPLAQDQPIMNQYTTTTLAIDSRRAQLPMTLQDGSDILSTSPIGMALDLSSDTLVPRPIPAEEEINESPTPLPALMVLNNEGILSAWWVVYNESIKQNTGYSGLNALPSGALNQSQQANPPQASPFANASSAISRPSPFASAGIAAPQATFGGSAFGKPAAPAFGSSGFSNTGSAAFGGASQLGQTKSAWGSTSTVPSSMGLGTSTFGSSAPFGASAGAAFGSVGGVGKQVSPWATGNTNAQPSNPTAAPAWSTSKVPGTSASPFGAVAGGSSGFAGLSQTTNQEKPAFASSQPFTTPSNSFGQPSGSSFASTVTLGSGTGGSTTGSVLSSWATPSAQNTPAPPSSFGQASFASQATQESDMNDADEQPQRRERDEATPTPQTKPTGIFGLGPGGFKIGSTFKPDGSAKDDLPKPDMSGVNSLFGSGFSTSLEQKPNEPVTPIKTEPGADDETKLPDVSTTPVSPPQADTVVVPPQSSPPSEQPSKNVSSETPVREPSQVSKPLATEDPAPLPPDFILKPKTSPKDKEDDLPPLAGSPPVEIQAPTSSVECSPLPSIEGPDVEESEELGSDEESQGDGGNQGETLPPPPDNGSNQSPGWSFEKPSGQPSIRAPSPPKLGEHNASQLRAESKSPKPSALAMSTTPMGFPKPAPFLPPPNAQLREMPRSPSPIRSTSTPVGGRFLGASTGSFQPRVSQATVRAPTPVQPPAEPTFEELSDEEDERTRAELQSEIVPTLHLAPFIAHQDYVGQTAKPGIPGQIERVYRDINGMVDTSGLNSRNLSAFVKGNTEIMPQQGRTREDVEEIDPDDNDLIDWGLDEIEDLAVIQQDMCDALESGCITDVEEKMNDMTGTQRNQLRLHTRALDLRKSIRAHNSANTAFALQVAPLSAEQISQQRALRSSFAQVQKQLRVAEDDVVLLRAKVSAAEAGRGRSTGDTPTMEAVTSTIMKMTGMIERRSGDIDVLETQLRKLRVNRTSSASPGPQASSGDDNLLRSREDSPFATPPPRRGRITHSSTASVHSGVASTLGKSFGLVDSPDSSPSTNGRNVDTADLVSSVGEAAIKENQRRTQRRKAVKDILVSRLNKRNGRNGDVNGANHGPV